MSLMPSWKKYKRLREENDGDYAGDIFNFHNRSDLPVDYERARTELIKTCFTKYPRKTMDFIKSLANRDAEIDSLLKKIDPSAEIGPMKPRHDDNERPVGQDGGDEFGMHQ